MNRFFQTAVVACALAAAPAAGAANAKVTAAIDSTVIEMGSRATITVDIADANSAGTFIDLPAAEVKAPKIMWILYLSKPIHFLRLSV